MYVAHKAHGLDDCNHTNDVVNQIILLNGLSSNDINASRIMCLIDNSVSFIFINFPNWFSSDLYYIYTFAYQEKLHLHYHIVRFKGLF